MEILLNDGRRVRRFELGPRARKAALWAPLAAAFLMAGSVGFGVVALDAAGDAHRRAAEAEARLDQERRLRLAETAEHEALTRQQADLGKAVGLLRLAFASLFSDEQLAEQAKTDPKLAALASHMTETSRRMEQLQARLEAVGRSLPEVRQGAPSGDEARLSAVREAREGFSNLLAAMRGWKEDPLFPSKRLEAALGSVSQALETVNALEGDFAAAVRKSSEELFGGAINGGCSRDVDRKIAESLESHLAALGEFEKLTARTLEVAAESVDSTGLAGHPAFGADGVRGAVAAATRSLAEASARLRAVHEAVRTVPQGTPMRDFIVTSGFGSRRDPFTKKAERHEGLDFVAPLGSRAFATANGTVVSAGSRGAYGLTVELDHGGNVRTRYAHLSRIDVAEGQKVRRGDGVGLMGSTGRSTGPHLHYEVLVGGEQRDPTGFMKAAVFSPACR